MREKDGGEQVDKVWRTDASGVITNQALDAGDQMERGGRRIFSIAISITMGSRAPPAVDDNGDGLIDDSSTYKLFKDGDAIDLSNGRGGFLIARLAFGTSHKHLLMKWVLRCFLREKDGGEKVDTRYGALMLLV